MLGAEPIPGVHGVTDREHEIHREAMASAQQAGITGLGYAYNIPHQSHMPPSMESSFYPPPWAPPAYGMFPFGPPGMMMPGLPPSVAPPPTDFSANDITTPVTYLSRRTGKDSGADSPPLLPTRERFSYTRYQLELLAAIYKNIRYPNSMQKQLIAKRVGITREQVKVWFQNRRRKDVVGKTSAKDEYLQTTARKMVPNDVVSSVLDELLTYKNNDKDQKVMRVMNMNLDEKKRRAAQRHVNCSTLSPASTGTDTNLSLSSSNGSSPATVASPLCDTIFADVYQQNGDGFKPEQGNREKAQTFALRAAQDIVAHDAGSLPSPTAGQAIALPVPHTTEAPSQAVSYRQAGALDANNATLLPLTTAISDGDSDDSSSTDLSVGSRRSAECGQSTADDAPEKPEYASNIDILGPPNTVVVHPHSVVSLKRSRCEDSSEEDGGDEEVEPPRKRRERLAQSGPVPPNAIAPQSEPIRFDGRAPDIRSNLYVQVPRYQRSPKGHLGAGQEVSDRVLSTGSLLPDPLPWSSGQWASRPADGHVQLYHAPALPTDPDFSQYSRDNPYAIQTMVRSSTGAGLDRDNVRELDGMPQLVGYPWERTALSNNNNISDPSTKQNCDKSLLNHISFLSPECSKLGSFNYDNTSCYPPMTNIRQDVFTPWNSYPGACTSFAQPVPRTDCAENNV